MNIYEEINYEKHPSMNYLISLRLTKQHSSRVITEIKFTFLFVTIVKHLPIIFLLAYRFFLLILGFFYSLLDRTRNRNRENSCTARENWNSRLLQK